MKAQKKPRSSPRLAPSRAAAVITGLGRTLTRTSHYEGVTMRGTGFMLNGSPIPSPGPRPRRRPPHLRG
jgi:hypothetical protein